MRLKNSYMLSAIIVFFALFLNIQEVDAMNTEFEIEHLPLERKNMFISNINVSRIGTEPKKKPIICFDVNYNGLIAVGQNESDRNTVCIYSRDGIFQYGYTFKCSGSVGVEWDGDNINIYFVRSDMLVSITPNGEIRDVLKVQNTFENNSYKNHLLYDTERINDGITYSIENDMGILNCVAASYSQIVVKDVAGVEYIIYDVGPSLLLKIIMIIGFYFIFATIAIVSIGRRIIKLNISSRISD